MPAHKGKDDLEKASDSLNLSHRLSAGAYKCLQSIANVAQTTSTEIYCVGGIVREIAAGYSKICTSPDLALIGDVSTFIDALVREVPNCSIVSVSQLKTAKVAFADIIVDIAAARTDSYESSGALPCISLVNDIETDLARRDFTVNAMAIELKPEGLGNLIDPFNGCADVRTGTMRMLRSDSFWEDPLRMLRGIRLAARYGYEFDPGTSQAIREAGKHLTKMSVASPQRVSNEWRLWFNCREALHTIVDSARRFGMLEALDLVDDFDPHRLAIDSPTPLERFAALAYTCLSSSVASLTNRLLMPSEWCAVALDVERVRYVVEQCRNQSIPDLKLYRSLATIRDEAIRGVILTELDDEVVNLLIDFRDRLRKISPVLKCDDLIELGVKQGPKVGILINELLEMRIRGNITNAKEERDYVISRLRTCS